MIFVWMHRYCPWNLNLLKFVKPYEFLASHVQFVLEQGSMVDILAVLETSSPRYWHKHQLRLMMAGLLNADSTAKSKIAWTPRDRNGQKRIVHLSLVKIRNKLAHSRLIATNIQCVLQNTHRSILLLLRHVVSASLYNCLFISVVFINSTLLGTGWFMTEENRNNYTNTFYFISDLNIYANEN